MSEERKAAIHERDVRWSTGGRAPDFEFRRKALATAAGGRRLGCGLYELPPGKKAWPFHSHLGNEEAIYVVKGRGALRVGDRTVPIEEGSYAAFPVGVAHAVHNDSDEPLRYLCFSTMVEPDILLYPDSNKVGLVAGSPPGGPRDEMTLSIFLRRDAEVRYWDGEA